MQLLERAKFSQKRGSSSEKFAESSQPKKNLKLTNVGSHFPTVSANGPRSPLSPAHRPGSVLGEIQHELEQVVIFATAPRPRKLLRQHFRRHGNSSEIDTLPTPARNARGKFLICASLCPALQHQCHPTLRIKSPSWLLQDPAF